MIISESTYFDSGANFTASISGDEGKVFYVKGGRAHVANVDFSLSPPGIVKLGKRSYCRQSTPLGGGELLLFADRLTIA